MRLDHVAWIGGSTCSGKTLLASWLTRRYGWELYAVDGREPKHGGEIDSRHYPAYASWAAMSLDDRWVHSSMDELVADTLALCKEAFEMAVAEVRAAPEGVVVEGFQLLPELVATVVSSPRHALFLVATPEFRRVTHFSRPHAWAMPARTSDPERAQRNRLERDDRLGRHILSTAREHGLKAIVVNGVRKFDEVAAEGDVYIAKAFRP